jgi:hypothetical protein
MVNSTFVEEWRQDLQVVVVVATHGEEFMNMVSGRQLVEVKQMYLDLLEKRGYKYKKGGNWILWGVRLLQP